jgi:hypothetical protein
MNEATASEDERGEASEQRKQVEDSEKAANKEQPRNWKDDALTDKVVEVPPVESETPMRGLDPERDREGKDEPSAQGEREGDSRQ